MRHIFDMKINPYVGNAEIYLDGHIISSQSQLRICGTDNFFNWYHKLPDLLYAEVNDKYKLRVKGSDIQYLLLQTVFNPNPECVAVEYIPYKSRFSIQQRMEWLFDVCKELCVQMPQIPNYTLDLEFNIVSAFYKQYQTKGVGALKIYVVYESKQVDNCMSCGAAKDDLVVLVDDSYKECVAEFKKCYVIKTNKQSLQKVVEEWLNLMIFAPYLAYGYRVLTQLKKKGSFICEAKKLMLIREEPVIRSNIVDKVEVGTSIKVDIEEFPKTALTLHILNTSVVNQQGDCLVARSPGDTSIDIISENGTVLMSQNIRVFRIDRVTDISLSAPSGQCVLLGDSFKINATWKPANAQNLNKAVWSCDNNGVLKNVGGGTFKAEKDGTSTVTLAIENVKKSIVIRVMKQPTDIKMPTEIKAKIKKSTASFSATLIPSGSACKSMDVRIADSQVAMWDANKKEVRPVSEGTTELIVSGYDSKGQIIIQKKCKVVILPEKDIITPPTIPTLMIVCLVLAVLTIKSELFIPCLIAGFVLSVVEIIMNAIPLVKQIGNSENRYRIIGAIVASVIFIGLFVWYMSLFY